MVLFVSGVGSSGWRKNTYWRTLWFLHNHPLTVLGMHTLCDAAWVLCSYCHCFLTSVLPTTSYHNFSYPSRPISSTWLPSNLPGGLFHVPTPACSVINKLCSPLPLVCTVLHFLKEGAQLVHHCTPRLCSQTGPGQRHTLGYSEPL